ncbi:glycosyl hydrolase 115 family protein [Bacillus timonensis]|uniref:glycosyl hydrolase 115 family protein n=1 Tax=Bacillus timonensis TaxID=1033734 RepID=UPI0002898B58|nr:glycosyl hydrolase 115 family protein [Bacillus timonensis]
MFWENYIVNDYHDGDFKLVHNNKAATILVEQEDYQSVVRAVKDLQNDIHKVSAIKPKIVHEWIAEEEAIIIGTIGKSNVIDQLISDGKLDVAEVKGKWESFVIQTVQQPLPNVEQALVIAGSDKRGTIFGIYDISEKIGVSPWYWWGDMPVKHRDDLLVKEGIYKQGEPSVKYRGIFLNDEGPSLMSWVRSNYPDFTHKFYEKIFELTLRLKANYLWPAMWDNTFYEDDEQNAVIADYYGVVMGTSHHEPMMRPHGDWKKHRNGPWDYSLNEEVLYNFWEEGVRRSKDYENIITLGMRGDGDEEMGGELTFEEKIQLLEKIITDQREMIATYVDSDVTKVPQLWALYKEVQDYYEHGMRVPDDITLLWGDDNFGNIRRLPTEEERERAGGAGIYYHVDYVGGPRSYKWINTVPITKIWEQMHKAYEYGTDRIWILNVGDLKPMEFQLEYFLRMAWNINEFTKDNSWEYSVAWAKRQFGPEYAEDIAYIITQYSKFNGRIKPEQLVDVPIYSWENYDEAEKVLAEFYEITNLAESIYGELPEELKDSFFQIVLYPAKASKIVTELYLKAEKSKLLAKQGRVSANIAAREVEHLFEEDSQFSFDYNKRTSLGKWNHMMDQTHIGYTYWQQPENNTMPEVARVEPKDSAEMGVFDNGGLKYDCYTKRHATIDIYNKGLQPFTYSIKANNPWLHVPSSQGLIITEKKIVVEIDWEHVPVGESVSGELKITGSEGSVFTVPVSVYNPAKPTRDSLEGFIEIDGYVSIEAEHYTNKKDTRDASWECIPGHGRTLSSMAIFPVTAESITTNFEHSPCLEYKMFLSNPGDVEVNLLVAPTLNFMEGKGARIGISFDDQPIQMIDAVKYSENGGFHYEDWAKSVIFNIREVKSNHQLKEKGYHTLKVWMVDPIVALQKIVVNTGGVKPSYLGPPESFYKGKAAEERYPIDHDSFMIPGTITKVGANEERKMFVEDSGIYEIQLSGSSNAVISVHLNGTWKDHEITETKNQLWLPAGTHQFHIDRENIDVELKLIDKDYLKIAPTLRKDVEAGNGVILQVGLYNRDQYSHKFSMELSLFNEAGIEIGSVILPGIAENNGKEMFNVGFKTKPKGVFTLKATLQYSGKSRNHQFDFQLY